MGEKKFSAAISVTLAVNCLAKKCAFPLKVETIWFQEIKGGKEESIF